MKIFCILGVACFLFILSSCGQLQDIEYTETNYEYNIDTLETYENGVDVFICYCDEGVLEIARDFHPLFHETIQILTFSPGLAGYQGYVIDGEWIGTIEIDGAHFAAVKDERFPDISTIDDVKNIVLSVFTENFIETQFKHVFEPKYMHFKEIDNVLYRKIVDGINPWTWDLESTCVSLISDDSFTIRTGTPNESNYTEPIIEIYFVLTPNGWRINRIVE